MSKRDLAIYLSGLITGDFLVGLWLFLSGDLPMSFLGIRITSQFMPWWMLLDVVIFILLVHFVYKKRGKKKHGKN